MIDRNALLTLSRDAGVLRGTLTPRSEPEHPAWRALGDGYIGINLTYLIHQQIGVAANLSQYSLVE